ncbi:MAG: MarC family protein [Pseudomonadota bacterium]
MLEMFPTAFATLFVMVDPIGLTPMFAALTAGMTARKRLGIAIRAVAVAAFLMVLFGLVGDWLLATLGISLPAFRIAGGLMLFLVAVEMLFQKRTERRTQEADKAPSEDDPSVFPLATPLIAGPGALAAMLLLTAEAMTPTASLGVFLAVGTVLGMCLATFVLTGPIERILGDVGIRVLTRVFGMLLGALSVQFILDGLIAFWEAVPK